MNIIENKDKMFVSFKCYSIIFCCQNISLAFFIFPDDSTRRFTTTNFDKSPQFKQYQQQLLNKGFALVAVSCN